MQARSRLVTCHNSIFVVVIIFLALSACEREERRFTEPAPLSDPANAPAASEFRPGPVPPQAQQKLATTVSATSGKGLYEENGWAVSEGKRLYTWFNCVGCHSHGGGGMGPALMDDQWIYGSAPEQIFQTIIQGGPNGMPAFGGRIPEQQVWQIVAYVRSLSGQLSKDVSSTRSDHMSVSPSEQRSERQTPKLVAPSARTQ